MKPYANVKFSFAMAKRGWKWISLNKDRILREILKISN